MAEINNVNDFSYIIRVNEKSVRIHCLCGSEYTHQTANWEPKQVDDLGNYETLATICPTCGRATFFNMSLPDSEFDEQEVWEEPHFPPGEKEARALVREVMWKHRPDLKGKDRAAHEKEKRDQLEKKYGLPLEDIKDQAKRAARLRMQENI